MPFSNTNTTNKYQHLLVVLVFVGNCYHVLLRLIALPILALMNTKPSLEAYLHNNELNIDIYRQLQDNYENFRDYYQFFNYLYNWFDFFERNQGNYLIIEKEFNETEIEDSQLIILLHYLIVVIKYYHSTGIENQFNFLPAGFQSFNFICELYEEVVEELNPEEVTEEIENDKNLNATTVTENTNKDILKESELITSNPTLKQKILVIKYLEQAGLLNLTKIHQDRTKQAQIISFLISQSYKTTYDALGESAIDLGNKKALTAVKELFEPLKDEFPQIVAQIEADIKKLKQK